MKKFRAVGTVVMGIGLLLNSIPAGAVPIDPINTRPVTINAGPEVPLQSLVNTMFGAGQVNVLTDQQDTGMWASSAYPNVAVPVLSFEYAGFAASNVFGIWSDSDMDTDTAPVMVDIFSGSATGINNGTFTAAMLKWLNPTTVQIQSFDPGVNTGIFAGINAYSFGFYLEVNATGNTYFTVDQLNGGSAQSVAFNKPGTDNWVIAFEDLNVGGNSDKDYNDMVVKVESIQPVPEPGTILLLGSGLLGLGLMRRKRAIKK